MDILELLKRPEGKTLEFKRDLSSPAGIIKSIVAFANTSGGTVLIGVEDRSRRVRGIAKPMEVEERLASLISDHVTPRIVPEIEVLPYGRTHVLALQVHPSPSRPHFVARDGLEQSTYVRVGSTNRKAGSELIAEMRRFAGGEAYDEQPLPSLDSEAIDFQAVSETFKPIRKLRKADLETLRLVTTYQGRKVPTVGGILLFGRDRAAHFPDAWIQAGRFAGTDRRKITDRLQMLSYPVDSIDEAVSFVEKHSLQGAEIGRTRRKDTWNLPPLAVREAIVNAVAHADYSQRGAPIRLAIFDDRLEVESPGVLPFGLTVEDLYRGISKLRNRVIGRVFHALGFMEHWGSGIQRMTAACKDVGLATPLLEEIGTSFRVTISTERLHPATLDETDQAILRFLERNEGQVTSQIAKAINLTSRATRTRLVKLVDRGLVQEVGTGPKDPTRRYFMIGRIE